MMTFEEWLEFCEYYIKNKNEIDKVELKKIMVLLKKMELFLN